MLDYQNSVENTMNKSKQNENKTITMPTQNFVEETLEYIGFHPNLSILYFRSYIYISYLTLFIYIENVCALEWRYSERISSDRRNPARGIQQEYLISLPLLFFMF
jgi:hypothetical protein